MYSDGRPDPYNFLLISCSEFKTITNSLEVIVKGENLKHMENSLQSKKIKKSLIRFH